MASTPIACPRETTDKRRATTTNSSSSHHHDSAPSRPYSLICTGVEPFHPVHASSQLGCAAVAPRNEVIFLPFWRAFHKLLGRFNLIIPEIGIFSSGEISNSCFHLIICTRHLLLARWGPGLREFLVGTFQIPGSQKIYIYFGLLEVEISKTES